MATGPLTDEILAKLADTSVIAPRDMEQIALQSLGWSGAAITTERERNGTNLWKFNYNILEGYRNRTAGPNGPNAKQVLYDKLVEASTKGLLDRTKIQFMIDEDSATTTPATTTPMAAATAGNGAVTNAADVAKELTDERIEKLSECITEDAELRKIAVTGLGMDARHVKTAINNDKNVNSAAFNILSKWCTGQEEGRVVAYQRLCEGLRKVNMGLLITEALK